jgi:hypothetical protein
MMLQMQLDAYKQNLTAAASTPPSQPSQPITNLFDSTARKLGKMIEEDPDNIEAISAFINPTTARAVWKWTSIPYTTFCSIQKKAASKIQVPGRTVSDERGDDRDIDQWILQNEDVLRRRLHNPSTHWTIGLVALDQCQYVFENSSVNDDYREITRSSLDGFLCLNQKRSPSIRIQPSDAKYREAFARQTYGQLNGLDWSNVFIAGGIAFASLLDVGADDVSNLAEEWKSSDIDIYVYGLRPHECNKKIKHIFSIFKKNLPPDAPMTVVKNSKTVSFLSSYPHRRFQIILKLVQNPAEVLLNFDLDICSMGYDGTTLWMLPRAARALESMYPTVYVRL